ncbi:uncharacterized protein K02A2.6-like [Ornithodoros turicata]|uniref:uncharacterized protein K02A2.6-like n=1 Tax=Ornithodoros turicata TaxID=34597 RepID=UPI0031394C1C
MPELLPVQHRLQCFNQKPFNVLGRAQLNVCWKEHSFKLEAIFTEANAINILGRTWISALRLDLNKLFVCVTESSPVLGSSLQELVTKYPAVFRDGLGRYTKTKVHLELKPDSQPKFFKARPIPFSIRTAVERDLERQVANGVLSPIETSSWTTPIVVVPKPNGAVRVCGDFSVTVNPQLDIAQYPLPRPEELFAKLNGGVIFSKLDLSEDTFRWSKTTMQRY